MRRVQGRGGAAVKKRNPVEGFRLKPLRRRAGGPSEPPAGSPGVRCQVEFPSERAALRGFLYRTDSAPPFSAVVIANGGSATIQIAADRNAEAFHQAGLAVLLYDHRNFGMSGGEPRPQRAGMPADAQDKGAVPRRVHPL
jgi:alpha-beta hydrolase superfamily lysophospholipase